jgi:hypothetical protein
MSIEELQASINILHNGFLISLMLTVLFLALSVLLFFRFEMRTVFRQMLGLEAKQRMSEFNQSDAATGPLRYNSAALGERTPIGLADGLRKAGSAAGSPSGSLSGRLRGKSRKLKQERGRPDGGETSSPTTALKDSKRVRVKRSRDKDRLVEELAAPAAAPVPTAASQVAPAAVPAPVDAPVAQPQPVAQALAAAPVMVTEVQQSAQLAVPPQPVMPAQTAQPAGPVANSGPAIKAALPGFTITKDVLVVHTEERLD